MAPPLRRRPRHLQAVRDLSPAAVVAAAVATATAVVNVVVAAAAVIVVVDAAVVGVLLLSMSATAAASTAVYQVAVRIDIWLRREIVFSVKLLSEETGKSDLASAMHPFFLRRISE